MTTKHQASAINVMKCRDHGVREVLCRWGPAARLKELALEKLPWVWG